MNSLQTNQTVPKPEGHPSTRNGAEIDLALCDLSENHRHQPRSLLQLLRISQLTHNPIENILKACPTIILPERSSLESWCRLEQEIVYLDLFYPNGGFNAITLEGMVDKIRSFIAAEPIMRAFTLDGVPANYDATVLSTGIGQIADPIQENMLFSYNYFIVSIYNATRCLNNIKPMKLKFNQTPITFTPKKNILAIPTTNAAYLISTAFVASSVLTQTHVAFPITITSSSSGGKFFKVKVHHKAFIAGSGISTGGTFWNYLIYLGPTNDISDIPDFYQAQQSGGGSTTLGPVRGTIMEPEDTASGGQRSTQIELTLPVSDLYLWSGPFTTGTVYAHFVLAPGNVVSPSPNVLVAVVHFSFFSEVKTTTIDGVPTININPSTMPLSTNVVNTPTILLSNTQLPLSTTGSFSFDPNELPLPVTLISEKKGKIVASSTYMEGGYNPYGNGQMNRKAPVLRILKSANTELGAKANVLSQEEMAKVALQQKQQKEETYQKIKENEPLNSNNLEAAENELNDKTPERTYGKIIEQPVSEKKISRDSPWFNIYAILTEYTEETEVYCCMLNTQDLIEEATNEYKDKLQNQKQPIIMGKQPKNKSMRERPADTHPTNKNNNTTTNKNDTTTNKSNLPVKNSPETPTEPVLNDKQLKDLTKSIEERKHNQSNAIIRMVSSLRSPASVLGWLLKDYVKKGSLPKRGFYVTVLKQLLKNDVLNHQSFSILINVSNTYDLFFVLHASFGFCEDFTEYVISMSKLSMINNTDAIAAIQDAVKQGSFDPYGNGQWDGVDHYQKARDEVLQQLVEMLTRDEAEKDIMSAEKNFQLINSQQGIIDNILTQLINAVNRSQYIGPGYSGGSNELSPNLHHLAERFLKPPLSHVDAAARQHDLVYSTTKDPVLIREADEVFKERLGTVPETATLADRVQGQLAIKAFQVKNAAEDVRDLFNSIFNGPRDNKELLIGGFNTYGNEQLSMIDTVALRADLIAMLKTTEIKQQTLLGHSPPGISTITDQLNPVVHDMYFNQVGRLKTSRTLKSTVITDDSLIDGHTGIPATGFVGAAPHALAQNAYSHFDYIAASGPKLEDGPIAETFNDATDTTKVINASRVETALYQGVNNYTLFGASVINDWFKHNTTIGSNAHVRAEIWRMKDMMDINTQFSPIHNIIHENYCKIKELGNIVKGVLYAALTVIRLSCVNYSQYISQINKEPNGNAATAPFGQNAIFVPVRREMFDSHALNALWVWILAHCPGGLYTAEMECAVKNTAFVNNAVAFNPFELYSEGNYNEVGADTVLDIVLVMTTERPAAGALGQAAQNWVYNIAPPGLPVQQMGNAQHPWWSAAPVNIAPLDITVLLPQILQQLANAGSSAAFNLSEQWWNSWYGSKKDTIAAKLIYMIQKFGFNRTSYISNDPLQSGIRSAVTSRVDNYFVIQQLTAAIWNSDIADHWQDCFGGVMVPYVQRPAYLLSTMHHIRRVSLFIKMQVIEKTDRTTQNEFILPTMGFFAHMYECAQAMRAILDNTLDASGGTSASINGYLFVVGQRLKQYRKSMHEKFFNGVLKELGIYDWIQMDSTDLAINQDPAFAADPDLGENYLYRRYISQKMFMTTKYYKPRADSMTKPMIATDAAYSTFPFTPEQQLVIRLDLSGTNYKNSEELTAYLIPTITRTAAVDPAVSLIERMFFFMFEKLGLNSRNVAFNCSIGSAALWARTYSGSNVLFQNLPPEVPREQWATVYTSQSLNGLVNNETLYLGWDAGTDDVINGVDQLWECYKQTDIPRTGFTNVQVKSSANLEELDNKLSGVKNETGTGDIKD